MVFVSEWSRSGTRSYGAFSLASFSSTFNEIFLFFAKKLETAMYLRHLSSKLIESTYGDAKLWKYRILVILICWVSKKLSISEFKSFITSCSGSTPIWNKHHYDCKNLYLIIVVITHRRKSGKKLYKENSQKYGAKWHIFAKTQKLVNFQGYLLAPSENVENGDWQQYGIFKP